MGWLHWSGLKFCLDLVPVDQRDAKARIRLGNEIDIRHILPTARTPMLVLHPMGDESCKIGEGQYVAEHILGARLVELPDDDHAVYLGDQDAIVDVIKALLAIIA